MTEGLVAFLGLLLFMVLVATLDHCEAREDEDTHE